MKTKRKRKSGKAFRAMKMDELAEATAAYGREMAIDTFGPLTPAARERWERAARKPGRPRRGKGVKVISVSVEQDLLRRSDRLAKDLGISRARLIEKGLGILLTRRKAFLVLAQRLARSSDAAEQARVKQELARRTFAGD